MSLRKMMKKQEAKKWKTVEIISVVQSRDLIQCLELFGVDSESIAILKNRRTKDVISDSSLIRFKKTVTQ